MCRWLLSVIFCVGTVFQATASSAFPPPGMTLPEYWGEELVWWHGRTSFKGQVIAPACTLAMEDRYQAVDMGAIPLRTLQSTPVGPEKKFRLRLRNCELAGTGKHVYTASRIRVTFDGSQGETPDKFSLAGQAEGIYLQITDNQGYVARAGKAMPPLLLNGNEEELSYTLRVVRNGYPLKAGDYYAILRFKVDYE
ncbi:type 1 fimbrial protein [Escherichia coli]|uniref:fimbrial protein n=1 Tax=Escherichia coli TaxID=562 RepID=UPI000DE3792B|nr:fimbrial protein [Escherichia coli]MCJ8377196.1 type 1 fimbrial protein [Escherichia coli]MCJ8419304.1 type 1 fimbrial protein [Escherichia coli]MDD8942942.1 type 1 fimbrial protein [Escherichia coli]HAX5018215.1 type 1 fimbrial protein [Escherichia coli]HBD4719333.1 type 1 fimbrial protein [Escherichia coli]